jgi:hypothetical protein
VSTVTEGVVVVVVVESGVDEELVLDTGSKSGPCNFE